MNPARVLVVDDDDTFRGLTIAELRSRGFAPTPAAGVQAAKMELARGEHDLVLLDLRLGDGSGLDVLRHAREHAPSVEVIVLSGQGDIETAIEAMRLGAFDYLRKPCPTDELEVTLQKARERQLLIERNEILSGGFAPPDLAGEFVGKSEPFRRVIEMIDRVATTDSSVLILGETGVGKDVVAKLIHARSKRRASPFVVVECAALHGDLLHNELFGHEKGAYTGATAAKHGLFEVADKGTIFLDEIGDVNLETQVKMLRVLETGRFRHVGGTREIAVDTRVVAATNRDLADMMEKGYFRKDLYFRLSTIRVDVPPLRERPADIPVLVEHFLSRANERFGQRRRFSAGAMARLSAYRWPGNVRELLHVVERSVILATGETIDESMLPSEIRESDDAGGPFATLETVERRHIRRVLSAVEGNRARAAAMLGISERTLYRRIKELGLDEKPDVRP
ncbi:sigma-54 dependent transcriptional regulator [bacterium]|nr:sigma-54 dependent transcriptional regulator [bacterium]